MDSTVRKKAVCNICTVRLVEMSYQRAPWFRLVREPLKVVMRLMAFFHRIDPDVYEVRSPECHGCMRFYKVALKEKSGLFRWLNGLVNPHFDALIERILTEEDVQLAQVYAKAAMSGKLESQPKKE